MTKDEAMKLALEAMETIAKTEYHIETPPIESLEEKMRRIARKAITALREALAQERSSDGQPAQQRTEELLEIFKDVDQCGPLLGMGQPARLPFGVGGGLVAIKTLLSRDPCVHANTAIQMIDAILAEQPAQQEPVAWGVDWGKAGDIPCVSIIKRLPGGGIEVVAVEYGPQRTWVGLTDEEITDMWAESSPYYHEDDFAKAIEAKLKEKNNG